MDAFTSSTSLELDSSLTDQDLQAIDAIEAAFLSSSSSKKRNSTQEDDRHQPDEARRQLPNSIRYLCTPCSVSPCRDRVKMRYPEMKFGGRIVYSRTAAEVEEAAEELLRSLKDKKEEMGKVPIGFDIEWKPSFTRGVLPGKVAVLQLCADTSTCHVMHIIHSGITQSLRSLLEDSRLPKVGVGIGNDCVKMFKDHNVSVKEVEDLSSLANKKLGGEPKHWGLKSLAELLVCKELSKPRGIRLGNWEVDVLSKKQQHYAATDAFASWHLHQVLKSLPDSNNAAERASEELEVVPQ